MTGIRRLRPPAGVNRRLAVVSLALMVSATPVSVRGALAAPPAVDTRFDGPGAAGTVTGIHFGSPVFLTETAAGAHSVVTADLDRDGDLDVISASRDDGKVRWFRNNGGTPPGFEERLAADARGAYAVYPADLNRDGAMDLLVAAVDTVAPSAADAAAVDQPQGAGSILWLRNDRNAVPGFIATPIISTLSYPVSVYAGDLDNDGDLDVMSASRDDNRVIWYEHNGQPEPGFTPHVLTDSANGAVSVHAGDLDNDGDLDIVSASENDDQIAWYANEGGGPPVFVKYVIRKSGVIAPPNIDYAKSVYVIDVNGDGRRDIVYASENANEIGWYENTGGSIPQFIQHIVATDADHIKYVSAGDLDLDGDVDLFSASTGDNKVAWYENDGATSPSFTPHIVTTAAAGARSVVPADVDGDGDKDLLVASRDDARVALYPNLTIHRSALFTVQPNSIVAIRDGSRHVVSGDLDRDGDPDLVSIGNGQVTWYENNGAAPPAFTPHVITEDIQGGRWVHVADLDSDGDLDIIGVSTRNDVIAWYENNGGRPPGFQGHVLTLSAKSPRAALAADLDGDGDLDVYSASDTDHMVAWYENDGGRPSRFAFHPITYDALYARSVYAADLDNDGDLDLLSAAQIVDEVAWYENVGGRPAGFIRRIITQGADGALHVHAADMDGDGDMDVISASENDNKVAWYENLRGQPLAFREHVIDINAGGVHAVYTSDADHDGDVDVFAAIEYEDAIGWYENDGNSPPGFVFHQVYNKALTAHGVYADDVDADGDLDLLATSRDDGKIMWFENLGGQYGLDVAATPSTEVVPGTRDDLMKVTVNHRGRSNDTRLLLGAFELEFRDGSGRQLTEPEIKSRIVRLYIYRDACCDGRFDPQVDPLITDVDSFTLSPEGRLIVPFASRDPNTWLGTGQSATFFVAADLIGTCDQAPAAFQTGLVVTSRTARDGESGLPLLAERMRTLDNATDTGVDAPHKLMISELMADNATIWQDPDEPTEYPDWIELYNAGLTPIDLGGMYLTDDLTDPKKYRIPAGLSIPPRGFLIFIADGEFTQGALHTNFRLDKVGETVGLIDTDAMNNQVIDVIAFTEQQTDQSFGRFPTGSENWQVLLAPTPNGRNLDQVYDYASYLPFIMYRLGCAGGR